jgi:hypothetical protein
VLHRHLHHRKRFTENRHEIQMSVDSVRFVHLADGGVHSGHPYTYTCTRSDRVRCQQSPTIALGIDSGDGDD